MDIDYSIEPNVDCHRLRTCTKLYSSVETSMPQERTYIVLGSGRGGTTMVAGAAALLGLPMNSAGSNFADSYNAEDFEVIAASQGRPIIFQDNGFARLGVQNVLDHEQRLENLLQVISHRNKIHSAWGFKDPNAYTYLREIIHAIRNPRLIVIYRDFFAIAEREFVTGGLPITAGLILALERYSEIQRLVLSLKAPTLAISYERARLQRDSFISNLSEFLGLSPSKEHLSKALQYISPVGGYKKPPAEQWSTATSSCPATERT